MLASNPREAWEPHRNALFRCGVSSNYIIFIKIKTRTEGSKLGQVLLACGIAAVGSGRQRVRNVESVPSWNPSSRLLGALGNPVTAAVVTARFPRPNWSCRIVNDNKRPAAGDCFFALTWMVSMRRHSHDVRCRGRDGGTKSSVDRFPP